MENLGFIEKIGRRHSRIINLFIYDTKFLTYCILLKYLNKLLIVFGFMYLYYIIFNKHVR